MMTNFSLHNNEGTGAEIAEYTMQHPSDRFRLNVLEGGKDSAPFDQAKWDRVMASINSFRGKLPVLTDEAMGTDALYN